jgi:hypothetical protein
MGWLLPAGMLAADGCIICSLTSYEKIEKFAHTEAENTEK